MEAMILGYPPEQAGQISVTATKEEWADAILAATSHDNLDGGGSLWELVDLLRDLGVDL